MANDSDEALSAYTAEVRHRIANTFQLLSALARLRSQKSGDDETRRQLQWMADAIGSVGGMERHRTAEGVDLAAYFTEVAPAWRRRHGGRPHAIVVQVEPLIAPDSTASTLVLIAQELVGNALIHGFPDGRVGTVYLVVRRLEDERWEMSVTDDGGGFGAETARERFGLWLVRSLAAQVRGAFEIDAACGVNARLTFTV